MNRRTVLAGFGTSLLGLAGCVAESDEGAEPTDQGDTTDPSTPDEVESTQRPHCEKEPETFEVEANGETRSFETVGTIPYPPVPDEFTPERTESFIQEHEEAYIRHDSVCDSADRIVGFLYRVEETWLFEDEGRDTVALVYAGGPTAGVGANGSIWQADIGFSGVVYAVTDAGVARTRFQELIEYDDAETVRTEIPDPVEDGQFVIQF